MYSQGDGLIYGHGSLLLPTSPSTAGGVATSTQHSANWKSQIIGQIQQRNQKEVKAYADIFGAYSRILLSQRALKTRAFQLEQEVMTTRQLSSLSATPGGPPSLGGETSGGGMNSGTQKLLEDKILKLQEDLTNAYRLQSENSNTFLRLKEQAEKDEKALLKKEEELADQTRAVISLQHTLQGEREATKERTRHLEQTLELLRAEVQSSRLLVKNQQAKLDKMAIENDAMITQMLKLREEQSHEQNELNTVKQELERATAIAKLAAANAANKSSIAPAEVDLSDMNSVIDHVAWTSNCHVVIPNDRRRTIRGHRGPVTCIRYNTAGTLFASSGTDGLVKIYDARTGGNRASLRGSKDCIMNVAFSTDDMMMLASGNDAISRIWSLKSSRVLHTLVGHSAKVWAATFTGDGAKVVTGSHDRTLKIWDVEDGACKKSILCQSSCNYLSLNRNDNTLATAHLDTQVRFWSLKTGELMHVMEDIHNGQATSVEFSRDGSLVVTCSRDNTVKVEHTITPTRDAPWLEPLLTRFFAWLFMLHTLQVTDIRMYKVLKVLEGTNRSPFRNLINWNRAIFSPDDAHVTVGGHAGEIFIWNVESGKMEAILPGVTLNDGGYTAPHTPPSASLSAVAASSAASSSSAAAFAAANTIGELAISCVDWCRNGKQVMACDQGGNIHVWEHEAKS